MAVKRKYIFCLHRVPSVVNESLMANHCGQDCGKDCGQDCEKVKDCGKTFASRFQVVFTSFSSRFQVFSKPEQAVASRWQVVGKSLASRWQLEQTFRVCDELQTPHASPQFFAVFFVKGKAKGKGKVKYKDWLFLLVILY